MASRRMYSIRLTNSAKFAKMPLSTQALYFHLGQNADDDGVVEAFQVMRTIGAAEDDLRILVAKGFIQILNEDLVAYITDWNENNFIRSDRKIDSMYKDLLVSVNPGIKLKERTQRADVAKKTAAALPISVEVEEIDDGQPVDNQWTTNGQPMDNQWTAQDRLGKDRLGKDSLEKEKPPKGGKEKEGADGAQMEPQRHKYGEYGWVLLTDAQHEKLITDYGQAEFDRALRYVDESAQSTGNRNKWRDWNLVMRRACREKWGHKQGYGNAIRNEPDPNNYDYSGMADEVWYDDLGGGKA